MIGVLEPGQRPFDAVLFLEVIALAQWFMIACRSKPGTMSVSPSFSTLIASRAALPPKAFSQRMARRSKAAARVGGGRAAEGPGAPHPHSEGQDVAPEVAEARLARPSPPPGARRRRGRVAGHRDALAQELGVVGIHLVRCERERLLHR